VDSQQWSLFQLAEYTLLRSLFLYVETEALVGSTLPTGLSNAVKRNDDILTFVKEVLPSGDEEFLGTLTLPRGTSIALWLDAVHSLSFAQPSQVTYELQPQGITFQQKNIPAIQVETGTVVVVRPISSNHTTNSLNQANRLTSSTNPKKQEASASDSINTDQDGNPSNHSSVTAAGLTRGQVHEKALQSVPLLSVSDESGSERKKQPCSDCQEAVQSGPIIEAGTPEDSFADEAIESPVIIQRLHNIQHNGLRQQRPPAAEVGAEGQKQVSFKCRRGSHRPASSTRRNSYRGGVDLCLIKTAPRMMNRPPSPPPIRSYQRDLIRYMVEAQAADSMSLQSNEVPALKADVRMTREEKKSSGWQMPDGGANKSKLVRSVEVFLVNLTRPVDMRNEPIPKKPGKSDSFPPSRGSAAAAKKGGNMKIGMRMKGGGSACCKSGYCTKCAPAIPRAP